MSLDSTASLVRYETWTISSDVDRSSLSVGKDSAYTSRVLAMRLEGTHSQSISHSLISRLEGGNQRTSCFLCTMLLRMPLNTRFTTPNNLFMSMVIFTPEPTLCWSLDAVIYSNDFAGVNTNVPLSCLYQAWPPYIGRLHVVGS
jgi:hypothetical protein